MARHSRTVRSLAAALVGLYAVAALGTTEAVTNAEAACGGWPTCGSLIPSSLPALVAWGHRLAVAAVGLVLLYAAVRAVRSRVPVHVMAALAVALGGYAIEIDIGRRAAAGDAVGTLHLVVALGVLACLVAALVWTLDDTEAARPETEPRGAANSTRDTGTRPEALPTPTRTGWRAVAAAYVRLTKPRLMWLLSLVALAGLVLGANGVPPLTRGVATLVGGALSIGSSGVFNNVFERDRDAEMARTSDRPVVTHEVSPWKALAFGVALLAAAIGTFLVFVNPIAAALDIVAVAFYAVGYTLVLKPNTSWNITIGGAVGAFPALIGYVAVTGGLGLPALLLGLVVFSWTPAHFYNLAMAYADDYEAGGYPMLPVVKGRAETRRHVLAYLGLTLAASLAFAATAGVTLVFVAITGAVAAIFLAAVVTTFRVDSDRTTLRAFHASNAYLGAFLIAVVLSGVLAA